MSQRRVVAALCMALVCGFGSALGLAKTSNARSATYCHAFAGVPFYYSPFYGQSSGGATQCPDGTPWQGELDLKNRAGNNLDTVPLSGNHTIYFQGNVVSCSGAYIHSFEWLNSNGTVTSDTSGENTQCA